MLLSFSLWKLLDGAAYSPTQSRYRSDYLMFNDDIQGTAATVLAGLYGALKVQGKGPEALSEQKFVVCGAGSAASGVLLTIRNAITRR